MTGGEREEGLPWACAHVLASPTGNVGHDHVLDDVQFGLAEPALDTEVPE
jgi:hypothetical protein